MVEEVERRNEGRGGDLDGGLLGKVVAITC